MEESRLIRRRNLAAWIGHSCSVACGTAGRNRKIAQRTDSLWIHYASGSAKTKITPALLDRLAGSPVTTRNWRTVLKIGEMLD